MWRSILSIMLGASLGALLRWLLNLKLNHLVPLMPLGTLSANLIGAYIIGFAIALFIQFPGITPEWRLVIITGFCGGLTTFSTFSAEVVTLLQEGRLAWSLGTIALHVIGSLLMTILGMASWVYIQKLTV